MDVVDTLNVNVFQLSEVQVHNVHNAFIRYCLDPDMSMSRKWDAWQVIRNFFDEYVTTDKYLDIMDMFLERKRPDMGARVFEHISDKSRSRPTADAYVRFFKRIAQAPDSGPMRKILNLLKIDSSVQFTTQLYNAQMMAYLAMDMPHTAMDCWADVGRSVEGPSYQSMEIVFSVCAITGSQGFRTAQEIWNKMTKLGVDIPASVYVKYVAAVAAGDGVGSACSMLEKMEHSVGSAPTQFE